MPHLDFVLIGDATLHFEEVEEMMTAQQQEWPLRFTKP